MRIYFPTYKNCYVCGGKNKKGLRLKPYFDNGFSCVDVFSDCLYSGAEGSMHGGITATIFDEAGYWAAFAETGKNCVTAELLIRYKINVKTGIQITSKVKIAKADSRIVYVEGILVDKDGQIYSRMKGKYIPLPGDFKDYFKGDESIQNLDIEEFRDKLGY